MKLKTIYIFLLAALLSCGMAGCGKEEKNTAVQPEPSQVSNTEETSEPEQSPETVSDTIDSNEALPSEEFPTEQPVQDNSIYQKTEEILEKMSLEDKIAQLFVILPEALVDAETVTAAGDATKTAYDKIPVGGIVYMEQNLNSADQVRAMLSNIQTYSIERTGLPIFTCVDEEGGTVRRIGGRDGFDAPYVESMDKIGATFQTDAAYQAGSVIGDYLSALGFNIDFAPVADVLSNPDNQVVRRRSFGDNADNTAAMSVSFLNGLQDHGVIGCFKHFPGHGATSGDTHEGYAYTNKSLEELNGCEWIPFRAGIDSGVKFIMAGHISLPNVTGDNTPASVSEILLKQVLRDQLGYQGIIITDAMNMGAIVQQFSSGEAAVRAIRAGADVILMPADFQSAYNSVLEAVQNGTLSQERINESVRRIIKIKLEILQSMEN